MTTDATKLVAATYADEDKALDALDFHSDGSEADASRVYAKWIRDEVVRDIDEAGLITEDEADDRFAHAFVTGGHSIDDVQFLALAERVVGDAVRNWR